MVTHTLKRPGQEPKRDLTGTTVHIAEYDRVSLKMIHSWPVGEYTLRADATCARGVVTELLEAQFPDPAHKGTRPLTEDDLVSLRRSVAGRLAEQEALTTVAL